MRICRLEANSKIVPAARVRQPAVRRLAALLVGGCVACLAAAPAVAEVPEEFADNPDAYAATAEEMKPYEVDIPGTDASFEMVPIPGGTFLMGSPDDEPDRMDDEGPQHPVQVEPFWMGKFEVTWDEYEIWNHSLDIQRRKITGAKPTPRDVVADAVTRPTKPYVDMTFGMGKEGFPAICMTQLAAKTYCEWISAKTGHYYRLPTEAEWEYACRAGTTSAYSFGDDADQLEEYAWHYENSEDGYSEVGSKKPNPWGLYDMHGNVAEWVLDQHVEDFYATLSPDDTTLNPLAVPTKLYPRVVRGGSWDDDPDALRSAARRGSSLDWKIQDPQIPQSIWYHTDATFVGFRIMRPFRLPTDQERAAYRAADADEE